MLIQSSEYPSKFFIHQGKIYINDLSTIEKITQDYDEQESKVYSYEHYLLDIADRIDLAQYVESNYSLLLKKAKDDYQQRKLEEALKPNQDELEKTKRETETIELLIELGVL